MILLFFYSIVDVILNNSTDFMRPKLLVQGDSVRDFNFFHKGIIESTS